MYIVLKVQTAVRLKICEVDKARLFAKNVSSSIYQTLLSKATYSNPYVHSYTDGGVCHPGAVGGSVSCPRKPGESNQRPSVNKMLALPLSQSHPKNNGCDMFVQFFNHLAKGVYRLAVLINEAKYS